MEQISVNLGKMYDGMEILKNKKNEFMKDKKQWTVKLEVSMTSYQQQMDNTKVMERELYKLKLSTMGQMDRFLYL